MDLTTAMIRLGHLATRKQLTMLGIGRRELDWALAQRTLLPIRRGWVATQSASQISITAVANNGRLTGATALRSYGIWAGTDLRIHVQVGRSAQHRVHDPDTPSDVFSPPLRDYSGIVIEWAPVEPVSADRCAWRTSVGTALGRFARHEDDEQVIAAFESAVHENRMSRADAVSTLRHLPRRIRRLLQRMNFLAESGLESIGRVRLEDLGYRLAQQVQIGPDRVDLVIDGWLVIEFDGDRWHDPVKDRRRTNRLIRAGYRVLRFGLFDVVEQWDVTIATIRAMHQEPVGDHAEQRW